MNILSQTYDKVTIVPNYERILWQTYDQTYDHYFVVISCKIDIKLA